MEAVALHAPADAAVGCDAVDRDQVLVGQDQIGGSDVLLHPMRVARTGLGLVAELLRSRTVPIPRDEQRSKRTMRMLTSTASLRARNLETHLAWANMLVPVVRERLTGDHAELRAQTLVQAALTCFDIAMSAWAESEGTGAVELLRRSFATLAAEQPT